MGQYSKPRLVVLSVFVIAFFIFNYYSLTYFAQQSALKDKIAQMVIYQFPSKQLKDAPFVGEAIREGLIGGLVIQQVDDSFVLEPSNSAISSLNNEIQSLSTASSQNKIFLAYDYSHVRNLLFQNGKEWITVLKNSKQAGFNLLLLPYAKDSTDTSNLIFRLDKSSKDSIKSGVQFFSNKQNMRLAVVDKSNDIESSIISALKNRADFIYLKQHHGDTRLRIFQIVNIIYNAVQNKKISSQQIQTAFSNIQLLKKEL